MFLISMPAGGEWVWMALGLSMFGIVFIPFVFFLLTLQQTLKLIAPENRYMKPGQVWLLFIPLFNIVWQFRVVDRMANSIQAEMRSRGMQVTERPAYNIGLAYCIFFCTTWIPIIGSLSGLGGLACWIIYWVKINEYRKQLANTPVIYGDNSSSIFDKSY